MASNVEYDPNAWDYDDPGAVLRLGALVASRTGDPQLHRRLETAWRIGGGKAFGLLLCEHIAHGMTATLGADAPRVEVPPWRSETAWDQATLDRVRAAATDAGWFCCLFRSSQPDEDWRDARAGVLGSHSAIVSGLWPKPNDSYCIETVGAPYVVQCDVRGVGCVIDVGWSALMERLVVRLATGNPMYPDGKFLDEPASFSSATWDQESPMALFDAAGNVLMPLDAPMLRLLGEKRAQEYRTRMHVTMTSVIPTLIGTLRSLGIDFGVQLEVIMDIWQTPPRLHLVQIRPSPGTLRGFTGTPERHGNLIARTLKVSKAGVTTGPRVVLTNLGADKRDGHEIAVGHDTPLELPLYRLALDLKCRRAADIAAALEEPALQELRAAVAGRMVFWKTLGIDCELSADLVAAIQCLEPAGQLYWKSLFPNSRHGRPGVVLFGSLDQQECAGAVDRGGVMASDLGHETYRKLLERAARDPSLTIQIISDGLVGEVRAR